SNSNLRQQQFLNRQMGRSKAVANHQQQAVKKSKQQTACHGKSQISTQEVQNLNVIPGLMVSQNPKCRLPHCGNRKTTYPCECYLPDRTQSTGRIDACKALFCHPKILTESPTDGARTSRPLSFLSRRTLRARCPRSVCVFQQPRLYFRHTE